MIEVKTPDGHVYGWYDETIKVGDIIIAYHRGFHRVTKIEDRSKVRSKYDRSDSPLFHYVMVFDSKGNAKKKGAINSCDAMYCRKATEAIPVEIKRLEDQIVAYNAILKSL